MRNFFDDLIQNTSEYNFKYELKQILRSLTAVIGDVDTTFNDSPQNLN